jgi:hypothetical protein
MITVLMHQGHQACVRQVHGHPCWYHHVAFYVAESARHHLVESPTK